MSYAWKNEPHMPSYLHSLEAHRLSYLKAIVENHSRPFNLSPGTTLENLIELDLWPCTRCMSDGKIFDPADYDIIEGNKLARHIACPLCGGRGHISKELFQKIHDKAIRPYRRTIKKHIEIALEVEKILEKLTEEEIKILEKWYGYVEPSRR